MPKAYVCLMVKRGADSFSIGIYGVPAAELTTTQNRLFTDVLAVDGSSHQDAFNKAREQLNARFPWLGVRLPPAIEENKT